MSSCNAQGHRLVNLESLRNALAKAGMSDVAASRICTTTAQTLEQLNHGDLPRWVDALDELAAAAAHLQQLGASSEFKKSTSTDTVTIDVTGGESTKAAGTVKPALEKLRPWRKGPYRIAGVDIDTEWRSDWKWQRLAPHISSLVGKRVLDVGCGNGYHGWRMRGAGAKLVLGIDPSPLFLVQFCALQHFMADPAFHLLPLKMETMPDQLAAFDTVFSMGVLYHRRDHQAHLRELKAAMSPGAELVLETLIVPGEGKQLVTPADSDPAATEPGAAGYRTAEAGVVESAAGDPIKPTTHGRYARMRNVWALPSAELLADWVTEAGFTNIRLVDINRTSTDEQRTTPWMPFESLAEALDPARPDYTIEGWPSPTRALLIANRAA